MAYICKNCNFRFEAKNVYDCPYCGKKEFVEKEKNASELLDDIDRLLE